MKIIIPRNLAKILLLHPLCCLSQVIEKIKIQHTVDTKGRPIAYDNFYSIDALALKWVSEWCKDNEEAFGRVVKVSGVLGRRVSMV